ncbi:MAG: Vitamin B12 transporter BtuB [Bacteroidota bacterium]|nr:MAG: Vitamin B12 transporter BtuB [Bacteroidota bacterium]
MLIRPQGSLTYTPKMLRLTALLCLFGLVAKSQVQQLDEVVLSAQRIKSKIQPLSASIISDSLNLTITQEVGGLLQQIPSLFVSSQQNFTQDTRISIRGFGARATFGIRGIKVLLDGIPITTPDGQTQLDHIPLSQLGNIEILRGLSSGLYGNACGGVISLQSAPIISATDISATLGDFESQSFAATWSKAQEKNRFRSIISHQKQKGYREWSAYENTLVSLSNETDLNNGNTLKIDYSLFHSPFAYDAGGLNLKQVHENRRQARKANMNYAAGEQVQQHQFSARLKTKNWLSYAFYTRRTLDAKLPFVLGGQIDLGRDYFGLGTQTSGAKKKWLWQYGIESAAQHDARLRFINDLGIRGEKTLHQTERFYSIGTYGIGEYLYLGWRFRAALRADIHHIRLTDFLGTNAGKKNLAAVSPMVAIHKKLNAELSGYLRWGTGFETPSLNELSANPSGETGFNSSLEPQKSSEIELGISFNKKRFDAFLTLFYTKTKNEIAPYEIEDFPSQNFYRNIGRTTRKGIEMEGNWQFISSGNLAFSFSQGRYLTETKKELPNVPQNQFTANWQQQFGKTKLSFHARHIGKRFANSENSVRVPQFWTYDVALQSKWHNALLTLGINNITNTYFFDNIRINAFGGRYFEPAATRQAFIKVVISI